jgi:glycerophosphoryl diester phosphodiesterase
MNLKTLLSLVLLCTCVLATFNCGGPEGKTGQESTKNMANQAVFDWQGHRGARGLLPENTIPAFLRALSYPEVITLELDVVVSADDRVIVSHEPWMSPEICLSPAGDRLPEDKEKRISIRKLTVEQIAAYDCGQLAHPRFPEQQQRPAEKPTLAAVFAAVDRFCIQQDRPSPRYNIELKYEPELEPDFVPDRNTFADLVLEEVAAWGKPELVTLQCFDPPMLEVIRAKNPDIQLAYLDEFPGNLKEKMDSLGFVPPIYSPYHKPLDANLVDSIREMNMRLVPWTVNEVSRMKELLELGVDGIITDYPDRISEALKD